MRDSCSSMPAAQGPHLGKVGEAQAGGARARHRLHQPADLQLSKAGDASKERGVEDASGHALSFQDTGRPPHASEPINPTARIQQFDVPADLAQRGGAAQRLQAGAGRAGGQQLRSNSWPAGRQVGRVLTIWRSHAVSHCTLSLKHAVGQHTNEGQQSYSPTKQATHHEDSPKLGGFQSAAPISVDQLQARHTRQDHRWDVVWAMHAISAHTT